MQRTRGGRGAGVIYQGLHMGSRASARVHARIHPVTTRFVKSVYLSSLSWKASASNRGKDVSSSCFTVFVASARARTSSHHPCRGSPRRRVAGCPHSRPRRSLGGRRRTGSRGREDCRARGSPRRSPSRRGAAIPSRRPHGQLDAGHDHHSRRCRASSRLSLESGAGNGRHRRRGVGSQSQTIDAV